MHPYHAGAMALSEAQFGSTMAPIFLDQLDCSGSETSLLECRYYTPLGLSTCQHSEDAGVRCIGKHLLHHRLGMGNILLYIVILGAYDNRIMVALQLLSSHQEWCFCIHLGIHYLKFTTSVHMQFI